MKFTEHATQTMRLAQEYARSKNHEYMGTEHILMGLVKDQGSNVSDFLKEAGITSDVLDKEIMLTVQPGPDFVFHSKLPQTPRAKLVIEESMSHAKQLGHDYIAPEHFLLGILNEGQNAAYSVLKRLGHDCEQLSKQLLYLLGHGEPEASELSEPDHYCDYQAAIKKIRQIVGRLETWPHSKTGTYKGRTDMGHGNMVKALNEIREILCNIS